MLLSYNQERNRRTQRNQHKKASSHTIHTHSYPFIPWIISNQKRITVSTIDIYLNYNCILYK